jgi:hypothetical protein
MALRRLEVAVVAQELTPALLPAAKVAAATAVKLERLLQPQVQQIRAAAAVAAAHKTMAALVGLASS